MPLDLHQCYEILQSSPGSSIEDVKKSYRSLIKKYHPDRFAHDPSLQRVYEEKMKLFSEAFRTLESLIKLHQATGAVPQQPEELHIRLDPVEVNGLWGFADADGYLRIPPRYQQAGEFSEGLARVCRDDCWGFVDMTGQEVIEPRFSLVGDFSEGRALAEYIRYGYLNRVGDWVLRPRFHAGSPFREGVAAVKLDGKWGYIQSNGDWFILPRFEDARPFQNGRAYASCHGRSVVVTRRGEVLFR